MNLPADIDASLLPGVLREMVSCIGLQATLRIVEHYGGVRLYVPVEIEADHPIAQMIGLDAARKLAAEYGGQDHFDIPRAAAALRAVRARQIRADRATGMTHRALARKYHLTERWIRHVLGDEETTAEQAGLF